MSILSRALGAVLVVGVTALAAAQTPQPFPRPGQQPVRAPLPPRTQGTERETPGPQTPAPADNNTGQQPAPAPAAPAAPAAAPGTPTEVELGVPLYPTLQYLGSFDAGLGQRYYLFGTATVYADIVQYYRNVLKARGSEVFEAPRVHMFDMGRFREQTMAFPPSVTVKDYSASGTGGYLHVPPEGPAVRYPTVIQIVPVPPGERR